LFTTVIKDYIWHSSVSRFMKGIHFCLHCYATIDGEIVVF